VFEGNRIPPLSGESLVPVFEGRTLKRKNAIFSEHFGNASIIDGDWKLVGRKVAGKRGVHADRWELYNLADDRTELHDLAKQMPDRVRSMSDQWLAWARKSQVYPKP
jgi:arylsulfatase